MQQETSNRSITFYENGKKHYKVTPPTVVTPITYIPEDNPYDCYLNQNDDSLSSIESNCSQSHDNLRLYPRI